MKKIISIAIIILLLSSCCPMKKNAYQPDYSPGPQTIVYKTKKDYSQNVPVILNDEKTAIVSYYGTGDLTYKGKIAYPTELVEGYLLDNIGIRKNVAYTSLIIEEYKKLDKMLTKDELFDLIIDKDPIEEMYSCGNRSKFTNELEEINKIITDKQLKNCKKLK